MTEPLDPRRMDPVLWRGLTQPRLSRGSVGGLGRRDVLRLMAGVGGAATLAACGGIQAQGKKADTSEDAVTKYWKAQKETGALNWANWDVYIDKKGKHRPTLERFEKETGIHVKYSTVILDNGPFFAKVQPTLSSGQYTGYDLAVISSGIYFNKFRDLGFLVPLDPDAHPNFDKYAGPKFKDPAFDPGNKLSIPYQGGFTGIGYNPERTGREITSWEDLKDPKFKGHVGMMGNNEDLPNIALLAVGVDPLKSTHADWEKARAWLDTVKPNVRNFYSQGYIDALARGDIWISMAWSGDVFQQNLSGEKIGSKLKFVIPDEGGLLFTDNFLILKGARNPVSAMKLMDYYYRPEIAAPLTEYNNYICPVPSAQALVKKDAAAAKGEDKSYLDNVATSFATFPTDAIYAKTTIGLTPKAGKELDAWNAVFEPVYQS
jgi:spermidine/putrescine transport system substrate-binding protein